MSLAEVRDTPGLDGYWQSKMKIKRKNRRRRSEDVFPIKVEGGADEYDQASGTRDIYLARNIRRKEHGRMGTPTSSVRSRWFACSRSRWTDPGICHGAWPARVAW